MSEAPPTARRVTSVTAERSLDASDCKMRATARCERLQNASERQTRKYGMRKTKKVMIDQNENDEEINLYRLLQ